MTDYKTIETNHWGVLQVTVGRDSLGNIRLWPKNSVTLNQWRKDPKTLVPPWLIPPDCKRLSDWDALVTDQLTNAVGENAQIMEAIGRDN